MHIAPISSCSRGGHLNIWRTCCAVICITLTADAWTPRIQAREQKAAESPTVATTITQAEVSSEPAARERGWLRDAMRRNVPRIEARTEAAMARRKRRRTSKAGLVGWGLVALGGGAAMFGYGSTEYCKTAGKNGTSDCGAGKALGLGLLVLGGVLLGVASAESDPMPTTLPPAPPLGPATYTPPIAIQPTSEAPRTIPRSLDDEIAENAIQDILKRPHSEMPSPQVTGSCSGSAAVITVQDDTAYSLSLYLRGPESRAITLNAGTSTTLRLPPGRYAVGASVPASNVRPHVGVWDLRGCQYGFQFYIQ